VSKADNRTIRNMVDPRVLGENFADITKCAGRESGLMEAPGRHSTNLNVGFTPNADIRS